MAVIMNQTGKAIITTTNTPRSNGSTLKESTLMEFVPISYLPLSSLRQAPAYQRLLNWKRVQKIAEDFDIRLFGAITIARYPGGSLGAGPADGRHRIEALVLRCGDSPSLQVPCYVIDVKDENEEAFLFEQMNTRRLQVSSADIFHSRITRKDPTALAVKATVERAGWTVDPHHPAPRPWNMLKTTDAAEYIYRSSPIDLVETLELINATWPEQVAATWRRTLIGVYQFRRYYSTQRAWDEMTVRDTLKRFTLRTILRSSGAAIGGLTNSKRGHFQMLANEFARFYNDGRAPGTHRFNIPI